MGCGTPQARVVLEEALQDDRPAVFAAQSLRISLEAARFLSNHHLAVLIQGDVSSTDGCRASCLLQSRLQQS